MSSYMGVNERKRHILKYKAGRFDTREELERAVVEGGEAGRTYHEMADDFDVSTSTVARIFNEARGTFDQETAKSDRLGKEEMERLMKLDKLVKEAARTEVSVNLSNGPFQKFRHALIELGVQDVMLGMDFGELHIAEAISIMEEAVIAHLAKQFENATLQKLIGSINTQEATNVRTTDRNDTGD